VKWIQNIDKKQQTQNAEEYAAHRREISKQSNYNKKESESVRDKRHRLRKEKNVSSKKESFTRAGRQSTLVIPSTSFLIISCICVEREEKSRNDT
jgi:hypothetical protein